MTPTQRLENPGIRPYYEFNKRLPDVFELNLREHRTRHSMTPHKIHALQCWLRIRNQYNCPRHLKIKGFKRIT